MNNDLFFPRLTRRDSYSTKTNGKYYKTYTFYRNEIAQDCKNRCIYCDIKENEIGFEGFVLDHFRPQLHFPDLISNPKNLVLSCPKCNRFKSDRWDIDFDCSDTHDEMCGFIDPFIESRLQYFSIEDDGNLLFIKPLALYLEKIFFLSRPSRKKVRHLRILKDTISIKIDDMLKEFSSKFSAWKEKKISSDEFEKFCEVHERNLLLVKSLNSSSQ